MKYLYHLPIVLLMLLLGLTGLKTYRTYGTQWDEYLQRNMGRVSYNYVAENNDSLLILNGRDYGVVVELPLYVLEKKFAPNQVAESIYLRHLACFTLFCLGVFVFYLVLLKLNFSVLWSFNGALMLVLSPRIYGHAFINSKDVPLMVFYILAYYSLLLLLEKASFKRCLFHAFTCALLIDTRITGVIIIPLTIVFYILFEYQKSDKKITALIGWRLINQLKFYFLFTAVFVYILWPYLWLNPVKNFLVAFLNMSHYRWKGYSLLFGESIFSFDTPWYFALAWIAITTPLLYVAFFVVGLSGILIQTFKLRWHIFKEKINLEKIMSFSFFLCPILAVIILKSVLYDTWRHLYFVYPFLLISSLYGALSLYKYLQLRKTGFVFYISLYALLGFELHKMTSAFPFEYVYFNELVSGKEENIRKNYDMDYWGISFKQAMEKVLEIDKSDTIKVTGNVYPAYSNYVLIKNNNPACRLQYVLKEKEADYYFTSFRYQPNDHDSLQHQKVFSFRYRNADIMSVFKVKSE